MEREKNTPFLRVIFRIPDYYVIHETEFKRPVDIAFQAETQSDGRWYRFLDCSAFCREIDCYFCSNYDKWC